MGNTLHKTNNQLVTAFKNNDQKVMHEVYQHIFPKFRSHAFKNSGNEAQAKDIFQEAFIACWQNVKDDKFDREGSLEAYLFTIAKNKWTDHLRSARFRKTVHQDVISLIGREEEEDEGQDNEAQNEQDIMKRALQELGNGCKDLLTLFYFERKNMEEIAEKLGIGGASARNKKYRCMEQLRALAQHIKNNG